jgi:hypothetical protein
MSEKDEPSTTHKQLAGVPLMKQVEQDVAAVELAAKNADIEEMRKLHGKMVGNMRDVSKLLDMLVEHYSGKTDRPRYEPNDSAIAAMQAVALAGLSLAKTAIEQRGKP